MLTTTLAIRAVLALLLSAASFTALLRDPAAAMAAPPGASAAQTDRVERTTAYQSAVDADLRYAMAIAPDAPPRVCR